MLQEKYTEAALMCLRAVERNDPSLLSEIDPCLFLNKSAKDFHKAHRRCSSFPDSTNYRKWNLVKKLSSENVMECPMESPRKIQKKSPEKRILNKHVGKLKPWNSMPNLTLEGVKTRQRSYTIKSCTTPSSPMHQKLSPSVLEVDYSGLLDLHSDKNKIIKKHKHKMSSALEEKVGKKADENTSTKSLPCKHHKADSFNIAINLVRSAPDYTFSVLPGEKDYKKRPKKSFIEDGGSSVLPMSTGK